MRHVLGTLVLVLGAANGAAAQGEALKAPAPLAPSVRVRDIARIESVRPNQLVGYGLVVGLNGTGDTQQAAFTIQSVMAMLQRFGVTIDQKRIRTKNAAVVMVTCDIPAFAKNGSKLDVTVASLGDATTLQGGVLLQTPLLGADDQPYAVAQGPVSIGGFSAGGGDNGVTKNHPTTGRVPGGALVEKEIGTTLVTDGYLRVNLNHPDFDNADRIATALNDQLGAGTATAIDAATVKVKSSENAIHTVAKLGEVRVQPAVPARVVMNERTGTVIIGGAVRLASVAVAQGSLTVEIQTDYDVSQPLPRSPKAETVVVPQTGVRAKEQKSALVELKPGATLAELVRALNALRVSPRDIIAIIQAIKTSGGLFAELEVQ